MDYFLYSDEEGDAMIRVRDTEDVKSLNRIGLQRGDINDDEAMKLGFPLGPTFALNAIDTRPIQSLEYNVDAVIAGEIDMLNVNMTVFMYLYWLCGMFSFKRVLIYCLFYHIKLYCIICDLSVLKASKNSPSIVKMQIYQLPFPGHHL